MRPAQTHAPAPLSSARRLLPYRKHRLALAAALAVSLFLPCVSPCIQTSTFDHVPRIIKTNENRANAQPQYLQSSADIHEALSQVRRAHIKQDDNWIRKFPLLQKLLLDARYFLSKFFEGLFNAARHVTPEIKPVAGLSNAAAQMVSMVISGILAFLALIALFFVLRWWLIYLENRRPMPEPRLNKEFDDTLLINAKHHWQEAQTYAAQQDFPEAIRQVYLASLCLFDESKLLPFDESRTNAEYQQVLAYKGNLPAESKMLFSALASHFEYARYGHYPAGEPDYSDASQKYQALSDAIQSATTSTQPKKRKQGGAR